MIAKTRDRTLKLARDTLTIEAAALHTMRDRLEGANADALARAALNTTEGALLGFVLAVAVSFVFALALSLSPLVRIGLYPYLMILQMTPVIVFAPILVIWVGAGLKSVTIITFLICFSHS